MTSIPPEPERWEDMPGRDTIKKKMNFKLMKRKAMDWCDIHARSARARRRWEKSGNNNNK